MVAAAATDIGRIRRQGRVAINRPAAARGYSEAGEAAGCPTTRGQYKDERMPPRNKVDAARVQQLLAQGMRQMDVARRLGICRSVVSVIARGMRREARA